MIHQPLGGAQGGQTDIDIQVKLSPSSITSSHHTEMAPILRQLSAVSLFFSSLFPCDFRDAWIFVTFII